MPGSIDKTPVGAPIPAHEQTPPAPVDIKSLRKGAELVERRTENSRTFVTERGPMVTEFSDQPMHFKDKDGKWQAIDSALVAGKEPGRIHNKAGGVQVSLPESLTGGPARVSTRGQFVEFSIHAADRSDHPEQDTPADQAPAPEASPDRDSSQPDPSSASPEQPAATGSDQATIELDDDVAPATSPVPTPNSIPAAANEGSPRPSAPAAAPATAANRAESPAPSVAKLEGAKATYKEAFEGVDIEYTAGPEGLKEELILAGPDAPSSYDFEVKMSPELRAEATPVGGIAFIDRDGQVWGQFIPPTAHDAAYPGASPADGATTDAKLEIVPGTSGLIVRLSLSEQWLKDPLRKFPVALDPTLWASGVNDYTFVTSAFPNNNFDGHPSMAVYGAPTPYRMLVKPVSELVTFFREPVDVLSATLSLTTQSDSTGVTAKPVGVYKATSEWVASQATWNQRKTGVPWSTPGGDFAAQAETILPNITGPAGVREWSVLSMVQGWMRGEPYHGAVIKYVNDSQAAPAIYFSPTSATFSIAWVPQLGLHDPFTYLSFPIGERRQALVNIAGGSLKLVETDVSLAGVAGLDAVVQRAYDSRGFNGSLGPNWEMWPQARERLDVLADGDVYWIGGPEHFLLFDRLPDGTYRSPQGYRGSLVKAADGKYRITMHDSGLTYNFDAGGYPQSTVDQNGNTITFYYQTDPGSGQKLLTSLIDTKGRSTEFRHNGPQKVTEVEDPSGRLHLYAYHPDGRLKSYTDPDNETTYYDYLSVPAGAVPPLSLITDPNGNKTKFEYELARDTQQLPAGIASWDFTYRLKALIRVTDPIALTGPTWNFDYSTQWKTKVTSPNPKDVKGTTYSYDKLGRVTEVLDPLDKTVKTSYTAEGFVKSRTDQATKTTTLDYSNDGRNNVTEVVSPMSVKQTASYDSTHVFYPKTVTNGQGNSVTFDYWASGNPKFATNELPAQNQFSFVYKANGTIEKTTDGVGNETFFDYYPNADLQRIRRPLGVGDESFQYDGLSRPTHVTDAKGQTTIYTYDKLDRVTQIDFHDGSSIVNDYDPGGRLLQTDNKSGPGLLDPIETVVYGYDRLNRQDSKTVGGVTFNSVFDGVGNLKSISQPGLTVTYDYNAVNLLTDLVEPGGHTTFEYDLAYRRTQVNYPNGVVQTTAYDDDGKVKSIIGSKGTTEITKFLYDYVNPDTGLPTDMVYKMTDSSGVTNYKYDQLERLTEAATPGGVFNFKVDGNGNRLRSSINGTTETRYAVNQADQLCYSVQGPGDDLALLTQKCETVTAPAGAATYSFDLNGNLTGQSDGRVLTYNSKDQNLSFKPGGLGASTTNMTYLGVGQAERTGAGSSSFKNGPLGLAIHTSGTLSTTNYIREPEGGLVSLRNGAGSYYYLFDRLGSVVALTDSSGNPVNRYFYDPFGNYLVGTTEAVANPWQYAGGFKDAFSGYYKFGARYYDPQIGRWTQPDPSRRDANSYLYGGGNPINAVDPTGLSWKDSLKKAWNKVKGRTFVDWTAWAAGSAASAGCGLIAIAGTPITGGLSLAALGVGCAALGAATSRGVRVAARYGSGDGGWKAGDSEVVLYDTMKNLACRTIEVYCIVVDSPANPMID